MNKVIKVGYVCFGEVNTPIERLQMKHDEALGVLQGLGYEVLDGGLVIDDPQYETADAALASCRAAIQAVWWCAWPAGCRHTR